MNKSVALILGILVFLAGAAVGRVFRTAPAAPADVRAHRPTAIPSAADPADRAPDLSAELARVSAEMAELKKTVEPLQETDRHLRPLLAAAPGGAASFRAPVSVNADGPDGVADLLGLDPGRQAALSRAFEETMRRIRSTEERHAGVKKDGKITEITVAAFPEEGAALARDWSQQLDGLLSSQEREKYRKYSMERSLFPMGLEQLGAQERTITVTRTGNTYTVSESATAGPRGGWTRSSMGDESILAPYRHLLNGAGAR